ncbi:MAG: hypothetical protein J5J06_03485 [Phycisphaerae bacterium]|nr:hypothetical protein [Phycisphaerae bacterium]
MKREVQRVTLAALALAMVPLAVVRASPSGPADAGSVGLAGENEFIIRPRLEVRVPSACRLMSETQRSHAGVFADFGKGLLLEIAQSSAEGISAQEALGIASSFASWPDTSVGVFVFAPDRIGRERWAVRTDWPVKDLSQRIRNLLDLPAAQDVFVGIRAEADGGGLVLKLNDEPFALVYGAEDGGSVLASHAELPLPPRTAAMKVAAAAAEKAGDEDAEENENKSDGDSPSSDNDAVITCRLNLKGTEQDSGATFLSSFQAISGVEYTGRVDGAGNWVEKIRIDWPPIAGVGAKVIFGRLKQTFFSPDEAFATLAVSVSAAPGLLDQLAGLGPQMMLRNEGEFEAVADLAAGSISQMIDDSMALTILPGTGVFPAPDFVVQARTEDPEALIKVLRKRTEQINKLYRERDLPEPWREEEVRGRTVFWSNSRSTMPGAILPLVLRPVLFVTQEKDDRDRERNYLVAGWTSVSPDSLVRRWIDFPRTKDFRQLPDRRKTNGQLWLNWQQVYRWVQPYIDLAISGASLHMLTPDREKIADDLTNAVVTAKLGYTGLSLSHEGPIPAAVIVLPSMWASASAVDRSGGSDLARERLACQQLKVLYHHCKLFRKDFGRWPAEVAELDGYIDFAGHPELLKLELSSSQQWSEFFTDMFTFDGEKKKVEEDEVEEGPGAGIDDDLYVIDWGRDRWTLGYKPGTLEHLEKLYIDQDGEIHRVVSKDKPAAAASGDAPPATSDASAEDGPQDQEEE